MSERPFEDPENTAVFTTRQVLEAGAPILRVSRDADDGAWQFHSSGVPSVEEARVVGLGEIVEKDASIRELWDLPQGWIATRATTGSPWQRQRNNAGICARAIAYLKPALSPDDSSGPVISVAGDDEPAMREVAPGLLEMYVVDEGSQFRLIQVRDCRSEGYDPARLQQTAAANLGRLADELAEVRSYGPVFVALMGGNFEASLLLCDRFWEEKVADVVAEPIVAAVPARDVLAFGSAGSSEAIAELRATVERVYANGDHLISRRLYVRSGGRWTPFDE